MPSLGFGELLVVGILLLLVVGPERLPHATRTLGRLYGRMRRAADELRRSLVLEADRLDEELRLKDLRARRVDAEAARKPKAGPGGSTAQPEPTPKAVVSPEEAAVIPPGFTAEEWMELPPHIREIVTSRRKDT